MNEQKLPGLLVGVESEIEGIICLEHLIRPDIFSHPGFTARDLMCCDFTCFSKEDELLKVWEVPFELSPVIDEDKVIGMVTRKAAGRALFREFARSAKLLDTVVNSASNGICAIDAEGIITTFNKAAEKFTRRKKEEALGHYLADVVIPTGLLDVIRTGEKQYDFKIEAFHRIYVSNRSPIIEEGKVVGAVAVFQDISELEEVSHELSMLSQLNEELVTIIDSSYDGIIVTDEFGAIVRSNAAASRLFQLRQEDLLRKFVDNLLELPSPTLWEEIVTKRKAITKELSERHLVVTGNPVFREDGSLMVIELAKRIANVDSSVFITGESGVGKEVIANFIHEHSKRCDFPFIKVNCAAIPEALLESELFGYEGGAFTGSRKEGKRGLLELADNGTLLLDEVGDSNDSRRVLNYG